MAYDFSITWCNNVTYSAPGYTWAVEASEYTQWKTDGTCHGQYQWVTVPEVLFSQILADAQAGGSSGGASPFTSEEVAALKYQAANPSPFNLSIEGGTLVGGAIATTWALAWGMKALRKALTTDGVQEV